MSHLCYSRSADRAGVSWTRVTLEASWRRWALKKRQDLDREGRRSGSCYFEMPEKAELGLRCSQLSGICMEVLTSQQVS